MQKRQMIKLFDFGFARQLPQQKTPDGRYLMSGMTGTIRYMAPEVYKGEPYTETCDVYSFSVMVWEMLSLKRPYHDITSLPRLVNRVFYKGRRPKIPRTWPRKLRKVVEAGWRHDAAGRASMSDIVTVMQDIVGEVEDPCDAMDTISVRSDGSENLLRRWEMTNSARKRSWAHRASSRIYQFSSEKRHLLQAVGAGSDNSKAGPNNKVNKNGGSNKGDNDTNAV